MNSLIINPYNWLKFNQALLPQACILCAASQGGELGICQSCVADLPWHSNEQCPQCGLLTYDRQICGHCIHSMPAFDITHALFRYEYPLRQMLQRYKYGELLALGNTFGHLLAASVKSLPDLIIPMPLHRQRLRERGFNQSLEIAKIVAKQLHLTLDGTACQRTKLSAPQASLPLKKRANNMKGAFHCERPLTGLRVALIDDVMTTGASLNALAKAVKKAGANHVECWVIARTLLANDGGTPISY